jgi:hypothetical protein
MNRATVVSAFLPLLLTSCAAGPKVTGYSAASGELRSEVLARITQIEKIQNNCTNLSAVAADDPALPQFMKGPNARVFGTGPSKEIWSVTACGAQHQYSVELMGNHGVMQLQNVQAIAP